MNLKTKLLFGSLSLMLAASIAANVYLYKKNNVLRIEILNNAYGSTARFIQDSAKSVVNNGNVSNVNEFDVMRDINAVQAKVDAESDPAKKAQIIKEFQDSLPQE